MIHTKFVWYIYYLVLICLHEELNVAEGLQDLSSSPEVLGRLEMFDVPHLLFDLNFLQSDPNEHPLIGWT